MGLGHSPTAITDKLVFCLDATNPKNFRLTEVEVLIVAGGGGGGMDMGGGGGGGGVIYNRAFAVNPNVPVIVTVGNGGSGAPAGGTNGQPGSHQFTIGASNGGNSKFGSLIAIGGGAGGSSYWGYLPNYGYGATGGSGGGASGYSGGVGSNGTRGGTGTPGQGFDGGGGANNYYSGGGGGAGGPGVSGPSKPNGGPGVLYPTMSPYYFGGGGGGASYELSTGGDGGIGGGGGGALGTTYGGAGLNNGSGGGGGSPYSWANTPGGNAGANTGGGGGGGAHYNANNKGGDGGSGIVIVRYKGPQKAVGGTVSSSNGYTFHTFTSVGSSTFIPCTIPNNSAISQVLDLSDNTVLNPVNSPIYSTANNGSIVFDGVNDYIDLNTNNIITGTNPFTFEAFYKVTNASVAAELFGNYGAGYTSNTIWISGRYGVFINGSVPYFQGAPLGVGTYHMAFTRTSDGVCTLYKNGVVDGTAISTTSISVGQNFRIGCDVNSIAEVFGGELYCLKVYNKVLTSTEILQNYNALRGRFGI